MRSARVVYDTIPTVTWEPLPERLPSSDLVIFRIELVRFTTFISTFSTWLSTDEHHRAQRYFHEKDRNRFVITRGILRLILGRYTHRNPSDIQFGSQGKKPVLRADDNWQYNVSHSGNWALIAVSAQPVGIDIEKIDDAFRFQDLLPETFGLAEQLYLQRHPDARPLFYHWWTRKEALVKATGQGINDYFREIPARDGTHEVQECVLGQRGHWTARNFEVTEGYTAAVAYESADRHPRFVEVTPELLPLLKAV